MRPSVLTDGECRARGGGVARVKALSARRIGVTCPLCLEFDTGCVRCEVCVMRCEVTATKGGCAGDGNRVVQAAERAHAEVGRAEYDTLGRDSRSAGHLKDE